MASVSMSVEKFDYAKQVSDKLGRMFTLREWCCVEACYDAKKTVDEALTEVKKVKHRS